MKAKTIESALARMSNMFMGTLTVKGPKASTALGDYKCINMTVATPPKPDKSSHKQAKRPILIRHTSREVRCRALEKQST